MTLFLRNEKNETILDLEVWVKTEDSYSFVELSLFIFSEYKISPLFKDCILVYK